MTIINESLAKIAAGSGIAFAGYAVGLGFAFTSRLLIARIGTEAEYGMYSLAFVVLNICAILGTLGLDGGVSRSLAFARGQGDSEKVRKLIPISFQFGLLASISLGILIFFTSDFLAIEIFDTEDLGSPLRIIAFGLPFFTLMNVITSMFRGFDDVKPRVYFNDILRNALFVLFLLPLFLFDLSFNGVFYGLVISLGVSFILLLMYVAKRLPSRAKLVGVSPVSPVATELLLFSAPLLGVSMLHMLIGWTDTFMLGVIKSDTEVGLYNVAHPMAQFIFAPLSAIILIYVPVVSRLYAQNAMSEIRRNFAILTKWLCSATLPLFVILFLYPEAALSLFGSNYTTASDALRILSVGAIVSNFLGPNGATFIAMGEPRFLMWVTLATAVLNVGLNIALIPTMGIEGAAIASVAAVSSINLIRVWRLYSLSKVQPISMNLLKPTVVSVVLMLLIHVIISNSITVVWWLLPIILVVFYVIYGLATLLTRSFSQEDIAMLLAIEKRAGINANFAKRFLQRFVY